MAYVGTAEACPNPLPVLAWWVVSPFQVTPLFLECFSQKFQLCHFFVCRFLTVCQGKPQSIGTLTWNSYRCCGVLLKSSCLNETVFAAGQISLLTVFCIFMVDWRVMASPNSTFVKKTYSNAPRSDFWKSHLRAIWCEEKSNLRKVHGFTRPLNWRY